MNSKGFSVEFNPPYCCSLFTIVIGVMHVYISGKDDDIYSASVYISFLKSSSMTDQSFVHNQKTA